MVNSETRSRPYLVSRAYATGLRTSDCRLSVTYVLWLNGAYRSRMLCYNSVADSYGSISIRLAVVAFRNSRSSKVIDLDVNRKPNSNFERISYRFEILTLENSLFLPPSLFDAP